MNLTNRRSLIHLLLLAAIIGGAMASQAFGSRLPTRSEYKYIKRASMAFCEGPQPSGCVWRGHVRISTIDRRFAWSESRNPDYSTSGILRRSNPRSNNWKVVEVYGGGIQECRWWWSKVNRRVVHEFKIQGLLGRGYPWTQGRC